MARYGMVIDIARCCGCYNCFLACKDEHCGQDYPNYAAAQPMTGQFWMNIIEKERGQYPKVKLAYIPVPCQHCEDAPCVKSAKDGAVYRRPDGIVIIDPEKARGQKQIVSSCPYGVIYWNAEQDLAQKCTLCAHLLDEGWKEPRCVEVCPTGALVFGDLDDPASGVSRLIAQGNAESLRPGNALKEKVVYIGLPKKFVAGTVVYGDTDECAGGVTVTLAGEDGERIVETNNFGDFEFEGLAGNTEYTVKIEAEGYQTKELPVSATDDVYLGIIIL
ncbi:MAG: carboxypeptidase regulatory-like domain-containing protein [Dehalococcoidales bacterium]|nr:carboxypeptidase regulatory-like domain-containing protein [Dehalococcoidales bacterium]